MWLRWEKAEAIAICCQIEMQKAKLFSPMDGDVHVFFFRQFSEAQIRGTDRLLIPLLVGCFNSNHGGSTIKILGNPAKMVGISVMWWKTKCVAPTGYH
jgi:hypothetical protein